MKGFKNEELSYDYYWYFIVYLCPDYVAFNCNGGYMSQVNHLKRITKILWDHHSEEIQEEEDWYFACKHWEINFTFDDDSQTIVAYKRKGCETDWSNYIVLARKVRKWKTIV